MELAPRYNPKESEDKWYKLWEEKEYFHAQANHEKKPFSIVIPPPNVTGILHMGHALNNTIQDILVRYNRMKGKEALWMPGTDHAGIATQNVVEKSLAKEGLKRQDLGRDKFIERVWIWKEQYGSTIVKQLRKLGCSCDWQRLRFTMDEEYSKAVTEVFIQLYEKNLIYQGSYIINWCPRCQTALSDEEAPHNDLQGNLYYIKYPLKIASRRGSPVTSHQSPDDYIVVATTRPETMLGDTAVAVNPKDKRYKKLIGKYLILPLAGREIRIIADTLVDPKFGTGAVKVTPAHDPNDYIMGKKHELEFVNVMHPDARMNESCGKYSGMDRFKAREAILEDLKEKGLLEKVEPHQLSAGHCYRCHTIIEPYLSKQWFVKMKPLAKPAIEAVKKGKIKFHPQRWTKVYLNWMENIQDWCISRQIWWGHRLPVYYCKNCTKQANESTVHSPQSTEKNKGIIVAKIKPQECPECGSKDIYQDEDVLDTWFSSWLWPFATFGWPFLTKGEGGGTKDDISKNAIPRSSLVPHPSSFDESDLKYFYPTSTLVTAPEIIFFWVARMIMAGFEFMGKQPFKDVYIHGTVRDIEGKKMSKSLGNVIDPLQIIDKYGTDALRFSIISITSQGQDVFLSEQRFEQGRNFANKIWNASRFILMNLDPMQVTVDLCEFYKKEELNIVNRWILSRFYSTLEGVNKSLDDFKFNEAVNLLYGFFWHEYCDWYLEIIKPDIKERQNQIVMFKILEKFLRALHPFMPFVTEEIWQKLPHAGDSIMVRPWPHIQEQIMDQKLEKNMTVLFDIITSIRNLRAEIEIKPEQNIPVSVFPHSKTAADLVAENKEVILNLAKLERLDILAQNAKPKGTISNICEAADIYLSFSGLIDIAKELQKAMQKLDNLKKVITGKEARLKNAEFIKKAPKDIVEKEQESLSQANDTIGRLERMVSELS